MSATTIVNQPSNLLSVQLPFLDGDPILANTTTQGWQEAPLITSLANGGFAVVWNDHTSLADNDAPLRARVFDGAGIAAAPDFKVSLDLIHGRELSPSILGRPDGDLAVVWSPRPSQSIAFRLFDEDGTPESGHVTVARTGLNSGTPMGVALDNGNFAIAWLKDAGEFRTVHAAIFGPDGETIVRDIAISTAPARYLTHSITAFGEGQFLVTWVEGLFGQTLQARVVHADGRQGEIFPLNTTPLSGNNGETLGFDHGATGLADGRVLITWHSTDEGGRAYINARILGADGQPDGPELDLRVHGNSPVVTALADGGFVLSWWNPSSDSGWNYLMRAFDADGDPISRITELSYGYGGISMTTLADGRVVIATATGDDGSGSAIGVQQFDFRKAAITFDGQALDDFAYGTKFADRLRGNAGDDHLMGNAGNDAISGGLGRDMLEGGDGDDTLLGQDGADTLVGGRGADRLVGSTGRDILRGEAGNDTLDGGDDVDYLTGGAGADRLRGGGGTDRFVYTAVTESRANAAGRDLILDFSREQKDGVDLRAIADTDFVFIGTAAFSGRAGEIRYASEGPHTVAYADINGDRRADMSIAFAGLDSLMAADFLV